MLGDGTTARSGRAPHAGGDGPAPARRRRMSARRKQSAVLRLLRGEDLELVSRELAVPAAELSGWRDAFLAAGGAPTGKTLLRRWRGFGVADVDQHHRPSPPHARQAARTDVRNAAGDTRSWMRPWQAVGPGMAGWTGVAERAFKSRARAPAP